MTQRGAYGEHLGVQPQVEYILTTGVARWLDEGKTHAQRGLQWKYTCGGRPEEGKVVHTR